MSRPRSGATIGVAHESDRLLRGGEFRTATDTSGSLPQVQLTRERLLAWRRLVGERATTAVLRRADFQVGADCRGRRLLGVRQRE